MKGRYATGMQARLLERLVRAEGAIVPYESMIAAAYGLSGDREPEDPMCVIRVILTRLRKHLPPGAIRNHRGIGYTLDPAAAATLPKRDKRLLVPVEEVES